EPGRPGEVGRAAELAGHHPRRHRRRRLRVRLVVPRPRRDRAGVLRAAGYLTNSTVNPYRSRLCGSGFVESNRVPDTMGVAMSSTCASTAWPRKTDSPAPGQPCGPWLKKLNDQSSPASPLAHSPGEKRSAYGMRSRLRWLNTL